ncbi:hypothetical protein CR513_17479, partial [Mucuna pruriens]
MKCMFLQKFFPASRTATIRKEICGVRQHSGETLHKYWERFNKLCATCPHHHISEQLLIQYFYKGLTMNDRSMIDASSGGALMDKMPATVRHLISNMASNAQQFGIRGAIDNLRLENQLTELTSLVRQLAIQQHQPNIATIVCGILAMAYVLSWSTLLICAPHCKKPIWKATISARVESRDICSSGIWIHIECASKTNEVSTTDSAISSTTVPTAATIENATSRQLAISRGPNETVSN